MTLPGGETVTITRGPDQDEYGDPVPGSGGSVTVVALVHPRTSEEPAHQNRGGVIVGLTAYLPPGTDIRYTDQVLARGALYDVEGEPGLWSDGTFDAGIQVALRRAQG